MTKKIFLVGIVLVLITLGVLTSQPWHKDPVTQTQVNTAQESEGNPPRIENRQLLKNLEIVEASLTSLAKPFDTNTPFKINRMWVERENVFAEYQNSKGELNQLLLKPDGKMFQAKAFFEGSESGWALVKGDGNYVSADALLYEKDPSGNWIRKN